MGRHRDREGECQVMTKAENGISLLDAKECRRLSASHRQMGRGEEGFSYQLPREDGSFQYLDFRLLVSRTIRQYVYVVFSYPVC